MHLQMCLLKADPMDDVAAFLSSSYASGCGAIVSKTTLSTAATTLGTAGDTFANSLARRPKDSSDVGKLIFPVITCVKDERNHVGHAYTLPERTWQIARITLYLVW